MRKLLSTAVVIAAVTGLTSGPAMASTATTSQTTSCPPGTIQVGDYCEVTAPVTIAIPSRVAQKLEQLAKQGFPITVQCTNACTVTITISIPLRDAQKLHLASTRLIKIGSATKSIAAEGQKTIRVPFTKKAKSRLVTLKKAKLKKTTLTLKVVVTDKKTGQKTTKIRKITVRL